MRLVLAVLVVILWLWAPAVARAGEVTLEGRVEVVYNKGNGLNQYYLVTPQGRYRVWAYILDPHQEAKEKALSVAAAKNYLVQITGELETTPAEKKIKIKDIVFKSQVQ
ncbi:MAG: hypothetical protein AB1896_22050 [Thermodesulfobacteriota bacterium]